MDIGRLFQVCCKRLQTGNYLYRGYLIYRKWDTWRWAKFKKGEDTVYSLKWKEHRYYTPEQCFISLFDTLKLPLTEDEYMEYEFLTKSDTELENRCIAELEQMKACKEQEDE